MSNSSPVGSKDVVSVPSIFVEGSSFDLASSLKVSADGLDDMTPTTAEHPLCLHDNGLFPSSKAASLERTNSSSCSTSFGSPLLSAASTSDQSSGASPFLLEGGGTPRHHGCVSPYSLPSFASTERLGTYIVYLEPSPGSYYAERLSTTRNYIGCVLGLDPSFAYPIHCSLSSFFTLSTPYDVDPGMVKARAARAIAESVHDVLNLWADPLAESNGPTSLPSADKKPLVRSAHAPRHKRLEKPLFRIQAVELQHGQEPSQKEINDQLCSVRVTPDGGIILPWDLEWLTKESENKSMEEVSSSPRKSRLAELCARMEAYLQAEIDDLQISGSRNASDTSGIRPKAARHTTLLNRKENPLSLNMDLLEIARVFDQAATQIDGSEVSWDMVVYELQSWGVFDTSEAGGLNVTPHDLQEVVRVSDIARLQ